MGGVSRVRRERSAASPLARQHAADLADLLLSLRAEAGLARNTLDAYRRDLERFLRRAGARGVARFEDVDAALVVDHLGELRRAGYAEASVARALAAIRVLARHLVQAGRVRRDPTALLAAPKLARPLPRALAAADVEALLAAPLDPRWSPREPWRAERDLALLEVLYACGARVERGGRAAARRAGSQAARRAPRRQGLEGAARPAGRARRPGGRALGRIRPARAAASGALALRLPDGARRPVHARRRVARRAPRGADRGHRGAELAARAAPFVRDAPGRRRRRPALRAGDARARVDPHDRGLHAPRRRRRRRGAPPAPSARMSERVEIDRARPARRRRSARAARGTEPDARRPGAAQRVDPVGLDVLRDPHRGRRAAAVPDGGHALRRGRADPGTFALARGAAWPRREHWGPAIVCGSLLMLGSNSLVCWAETRVDSSVAAVIIACVPLWMLLFDWGRRNGVRPPAPALAGVALGIAGVALLSAPDPEHPLDPLGLLALFGATISWSFGSLYARSARLPESQLVSTAMQMLCGGALQLVAGLALGEGARLDVSRIGRSTSPRWPGSSSPARWSASPPTSGSSRTRRPPWRRRTVRESARGRGAGRRAPRERIGPRHGGGGCTDPVRRRARGRAPEIPVTDLTQRVGTVPDGRRRPAPRGGGRGAPRWS
jgi:hypothetical protein